MVPDGSNTPIYGTVNDAKDEISVIALAIAGKVVERQLDAEDQSKLVDSFIEELGE